MEGNGGQARRVLAETSRWCPRRRSEPPEPNDDAHELMSPPQKALIKRHGLRQVSAAFTLNREQDSHGSSVEGPALLTEGQPSRSAPALISEGDGESGAWQPR
jgi:hypothetical protein